jgi:hypothetical protein
MRPKQMRPNVILICRDFTEMISLSNIRKEISKKKINLKHFDIVEDFYNDGTDDKNDLIGPPGICVDNELKEKLFILLFHYCKVHWDGRIFYVNAGKKWVKLSEIEIGYDGVNNAGDEVVIVKDSKGNVLSKLV